MTQWNLQKAASSFKENRIGTSHDKKMNLVYPSENEIKTGHLWVCILALHLHWQKQLRSTEGHPCPFPMDAGRSSSYQLVFNAMNLTSLSASWFMTANRESVKPAFLWVGNGLEYLDSFHVQSQPVMLDIKETSENSLDLLQTQTEIQGDESLLAEGKCHEYIIEAYTSNLRGKSCSCVSKKCTLILNKISNMCWGNFVGFYPNGLVKNYLRERAYTHYVHYACHLN